MLNLYGLALVSEGRVSSNHKELWNPAKCRNDLLSEPIAEILLLRVAAQIVKRQDRNGRPVRQRKGHLFHRGDFNWWEGSTPNQQTAHYQKECGHHRKSYFKPPPRLGPFFPDNFSHYLGIHKSFIDPHRLWDILYTLLPEELVPQRKLAFDLIKDGA